MPLNAEDAMFYVSTRDAGEKPVRRTFSEILLAGLADDGGLYLPESYPQISTEELESYRRLSYAELACEILSKFAPEIPKADLKRITENTYSPAVYRNVRPGENASDITPVRLLENENNHPLWLLSLSNGPTLAFKDMAMQLLGALFEYMLEKTGKSLNILGATSGDTGSAAEYAMRGRKGIRVFMLSPHNKMSAFQTAQMFSLEDKNIFNIAVKGVFDDCQDIVKAVSNDLPYKSRQKIGTVNSINWARVAAQCVYYFKAYLAITKKPGEKVSFTVPSGNFGNICAGHIARMMGLPISKLVVATNENDVLDEFFRTGVYRVRKSSETRHTSSPSMDISKASNFERFVCDLLAGDRARVASLFAQIEKKGSFDLSGATGADGSEFSKVPSFGFESGSSTHADRIATIKGAMDKYGIMIDTHTADGLKVAKEHLEAGIPMVVLETAQAAKFNETIREALGRDAIRPAGFENIEDKPQRFTVIDADASAVKSIISTETGL